jgi:hypothetical protein
VLFTSSHAGDDTDRVALWFHRQQQPQVSYFVELAQWRYKTIHDDVNYTFAVDLPELPIENGALVLNSAKLGEWFASPDAWREKSLQVLDSLEEAVKSGLATGTAIKSVTVTEVFGGTHGGDPRREFETPASRPLRDEERQQALDAALADIAARRKLIKDNSVEMYESLKRAFPLREFAAAPNADE